MFIYTNSEFYTIFLSLIMYFCSLLLLHFFVCISSFVSTCTINWPLYFICQTFPASNPIIHSKYISPYLIAYKILTKHVFCFPLYVLLLALSFFSLPLSLRFFFSNRTDLPHSPFPSWIYLFLSISLLDVLFLAFSFSISQSFLFK